MLDRTSALSTFPGYFRAEYRRSEYNTDLLVVSISSARGFAFHRSDFQAPTLFISDKLNLYYMKGYEGLYKSLREFIEQERFSQVAFVGISKAGWACLALSNLFANRDLSRTFYSLVFSPQTLLYPENRNLPFPSYIRLIKESETDEALKRMLVRHGALPDLNQFNLIVDAYYGSRNAEDSNEARNLSGISVALRPLPISCHLSHLPFVADTSNRAIATKLIDAASAQGAAVGDGLPEDQKRLYVDEFVKFGKQRNVVDILHGLLRPIASLKLAVAAFLCDGFTAALVEVAIA